MEKQGQETEQTRISTEKCATDWLHAPVWSREEHVANPPNLVGLPAHFSVKIEGWILSVCDDQKQNSVKKAQ